MERKAQKDPMSCCKKKTDFNKKFQEALQGLSDIQKEIDGLKEGERKRKSVSQPASPRSAENTTDRSVSIPTKDMELDKNKAKETAEIPPASKIKNSGSNFSNSAPSYETLSGVTSKESSTPKIKNPDAGTSSGFSAETSILTKNMEIFKKKAKQKMEIEKKLQEKKRQQEEAVREQVRREQEKAREEQAKKVSDEHKRKLTIAQLKREEQEKRRQLVQRNAIDMNRPREICHFFEAIMDSEEKLEGFLEGPIITF